MASSGARVMIRTVGVMSSGEVNTNSNRVRVRARAVLMNCRVILLLATEVVLQLLMQMLDEVKSRSSSKTWNEGIILFGTPTANRSSEIFCLPVSRKT